MADPWSTVFTPIPRVGTGTVFGTRLIPGAVLFNLTHRPDLLKSLTHDRACDHVHTGNLICRLSPHLSRFIRPDDITCGGSCTAVRWFSRDWIGGACGRGHPLVRIGNDPIWPCGIATDRRVGEAIRLCIVIAHQQGHHHRHREDRTIRRAVRIYSLCLRFPAGLRVTLPGYGSRRSSL